MITLDQIGSVGTRIPPIASIPSDMRPISPRLLHRFEPISLAQMDSVALMDRADTKYVMNMWQLVQSLAMLSDQYWMLEIDGLRAQHYQTIYFDTVDLALYAAHHDQKRNRYKVRSRRYVDSSLSFLEVKLKTNRDHTIKSRTQTRDLVTRFTPETGSFLNTHFPLTAELLSPRLWNDFYRVTLVSKSRQERLTLDMNVQLRSDWRAASLSDIAIAEVKQSKLDRDSDFGRLMRAMNIRPTGFSKYCIGISLLYPQVKHNHFKPTLRLLGKLTGGNWDA
jgi:hypothetical protein